ncbi:hypothetical protein T484DRAFT_1776001 [Baffinella frigidus]|nr:hypothetical protein T484DRAFT_1776001 [Cryptophyta sp. CCMP2293]
MRGGAGCLLLLCCVAFPEEGEEEVQEEWNGEMPEFGGGRELPEAIQREKNRLEKIMDRNKDEEPGPYYPQMGERKGLSQQRLETVRKDIMDDDIDEIRLDNNTLVSPEEFMNCSGPPLVVERVTHTFHCPDLDDPFGSLPPVAVDPDDNQFNFAYDEDSDARDSSAGLSSVLMEELGEGGEEEEAGKIAAEMMGGPCEEVEEHEWKADREQYAGPVTKDDASQGHAAGGAHGARGAGGAGGAASGLGPVPEPQTLQECEDLFEEHQTEWVTSGAIPPARTTTAPSPPAPPAAAGGEVRGAPPIVGVSRAGDAAEGGVVPAAGGVPSVDKASGVAVAGEGRAGGGGQPPRETMSLEARLLDYYSVANASKPADEIQRWRLWLGIKWLAQTAAFNQ